MRISYGGVEMSLTPRMEKLVRYECSKCNKLWALTPRALFITGRSPIFCGYERNGRKKWRNEGHCGCGTAFDYPMVIVNEE